MKRKYWLARQIKLAQDNIAEWPQYMRDWFRA